VTLHQGLRRRKDFFWEKLMKEVAFRLCIFRQRSSSLAPGSFQTIVTNLAGQAGTTSYTDTSAPAPGPWYYRVGVP
jgi:hypothetical protein